MLPSYGCCIGAEGIAGVVFWFLRVIENLNPLPLLWAAIAEADPEFAFVGNAIYGVAKEHPVRSHGVLVVDIQTYRFFYHV